MAANVGVRARLAYAVASREVADYARGLVGDTATPMLPGERIRAARRLRVLALSVLDRAVLVELAAGASWANVADALGLPEAEVRRRYQETAARWVSGQSPDEADLDLSIYGDFSTGLHPDSDPEGMAAALDAWYLRHSEPWDERADGPVTRALQT